MTCTNAANPTFTPAWKQPKHNGRTKCSRCGGSDHNVRRCAQTEITRTDRLCLDCGLVLEATHDRGFRRQRCKSCFKKSVEIKPRACAGCGLEFLPAIGRRKVCSESCRRLVVSRRHKGVFDSLEGSVIGDWTVLLHKEASRCLCQCACGVEQMVSACALRDGTRTCCPSCVKRKRAESITEEQKAIAEAHRRALANAAGRRHYDRMSPEEKARKQALSRAIAAARGLTEEQKQKYKQQRAINVSRARELVHALKAKPCMDCGQAFHHVCMDFDHRTGETKVAGVSELVKRGASVDAIMSEVAKCDLVCATCHRVRTFNRHQGLEPESFRGAGGQDGEASAPTGPSVKTDS
jgi:hypothetical protein